MERKQRIVNSYLLHQYPEQVQSEFAEWFATPYDTEAKDGAMREQWEKLEPSLNGFKTRCSYKTVLEKIQKSEARVRRTAVMRSVLRVAAAVVMAFALITAVKLFVESERRVEWEEVYVANGQSREVTLNDGSVLRLAAGSRLIYPTEFDGDVRRVYLSGEAYADIAKDEHRRFIVSTEQVDVVVHGTKFNVRSYESNSEVELMLLEGAVDMQTKSLSQNRVISMRPGDFLKLDKRSGRVIYESVPKDMFSQTPLTQKLTFINSRLGDISMQLERLFNVRIIIDQAELAEERYYSAFVNNESLDRILSTLEQNGRMSYYWKNGTIHLCYINKK